MELPSSRIPVKKDMPVRLDEEAGEATTKRMSTRVKKDMPIRFDDKAGEVTTNSNEHTPVKKVRSNEANCATAGCPWMTTDNRTTSLHVSPEILIPFAN